MDRRAIQQISSAIRRMDPARFSSSVDLYLNDSVTDNNRKMSRFFRKKRFLSDNKTRERVSQEACAIISFSKRALNHLKKFQINGHYHKGIPETDEKTRWYFRQMKDHQRELLTGISEETEIILNMVIQADQTRDLLREHSKTIGEAAYLMGIITERLTQSSAPLISGPPTDSRDADSGGRSEDLIGSKPTVSPQPSTDPEEPENRWLIPLKPVKLVPVKIRDDNDIRQITTALQNIRESEDRWVSSLSDDAHTDLSAKALSVCENLGRNTQNDIYQRKQKLITAVKELKFGWKLLKKLAIKGYSPNIQPALDTLIEKHNDRRYKFVKQIREYRENEFPAD